MVVCFFMTLWKSPAGLRGCFKYEETSCEGVFTLPSLTEVSQVHTQYPWCSKRKEQPQSPSHEAKNWKQEEKQPQCRDIHSGTLFSPSFFLMFFDITSSVGDPLLPLPIVFPSVISSAPAAEWLSCNDGVCRYYISGSKKIANLVGWRNKLSLRWIKPVWWSRASCWEWNQSTSYVG